MAKERKRSPQREKVAAPRRPFWYWPVAVSGWIAAVLVWTLELPGKLNSFYEQKDQAWLHIAPASANPVTYEGRWTNDLKLRPNENLITDGSKPIDNGTVQLDLHQDKTGEFSGEIETSLLGKSLVPWSRISVMGHVQSLGGFQGEVWDVVDNRHRTIANFRLTLSSEVGGQAIRFSADPKFSQLVPSEAILWRTDATMSSGQMGTEYSKVLMKAVGQKQRTN